MKVFAFIFVLINVSGLSHARETLLVSYSGSNDFPPFAFAQPIPKDNPGIFAEMVEAILNRAGLDFEFVFLPATRTNLAIKLGNIHIDITSPAWHEGVPDYFVMTDHFMVFNDYFIYNNNAPKIVETADDVFHSKLRVGLVRGYYYPSREMFYSVSDLRNERALLNMLAINRLDVVIMNDLTMLYLSKELHLNNLRIGPLHSEGLLTLRVTKHKAHLLSSLNQAITELKKEDYFNDVLNKYKLYL